MCYISINKSTPNAMTPFILDCTNKEFEDICTDALCKIDDLLQEAGDMNDEHALAYLDGAYEFIELAADMSRKDQLTAKSRNEVRRCIKYSLRILA